MIFKSYVVEENIEILKNNLILFYGENTGLIDEFKNLIIRKNYKNNIIKFFQEDIINNNKIFFNEINNSSLFNDEKIFIIQNVDNKFLKTVEEIFLSNKDQKIYLFANTLDKKSKLRNFFEKEKLTDIIPCYKDTEITFKKIIRQSLRNFSGVSNEAINLMIECCNNDRSKLKNELDKIKSYFIKNNININELSKLLNFKENDDFGEIRDSALIGDKNKTNKLLNSTIINADKNILYISILAQRLSRIEEVINNNKGNISMAIENLKPPIFWKDKQMFISQANLWKRKTLRKALSDIYNVELKIKNNSVIDKSILLKKLVIDLCNLANAA